MPRLYAAAAFSASIIRNFILKYKSVLCVPFLAAVCYNMQNRKQEALMDIQERVAGVVEALKESYPDPRCALEYE